MRKHGHVNYHVHNPEHHAFRIDVDDVVGKWISPELKETHIDMHDVLSGDFAADVDAVMGRRKLDHMEAYAQSKLAITVWTQELATSLPTGPVVLAVNPGSLLASKMVMEGFGVAGNDLSIGADVLIKAALDDGFANKSGAYFDNNSGHFAPSYSSDRSTEHRHAVMQTIEKLTS